MSGWAGEWGGGGWAGGSPGSPRTCFLYPKARQIRKTMSLGIPGVRTPGNPKDMVFAPKRFKNHENHVLGDPGGPDPRDPQGHGFLYPKAAKIMKTVSMGIPGRARGGGGPKVASPRGKAQPWARARAGAGDARRVRPITLSPYGAAPTPLARSNSPQGAQKISLLAVASLAQALYPSGAVNTSRRSSRVSVPSWWICRMAIAGAFGRPCLCSGVRICCGRTRLLP